MGRSVWNKPVVVGLLLAGCSLVLGYVGYRDLSPGGGRSDALFRTLQLFVLEASGRQQGTPWELNVARFMAPVAVAYATVATIAVLLREQVQALLVGWFARDHVVVIGLGRSSGLAATSLRRAKASVVVVEADATNERLSGLRAVGARVLIGDASEAEILIRARIRRAQHVIVSTGDDSRNLEIADKVMAVLGDGRAGQRTIVHVAVDDLKLWFELGRLQLVQVRSGVLLEFYNLVDRAARAFLDEVALRGGELASVHLHGSGPMLERTLVHLVRRSAVSGIRPNLVVTVDGAAAGVLALLEDEPWITRSADLVIGTGSLNEHDDLVTALVCSSGTDASAIANALVLAEPASRAQVFVAVAGQQAGGFLRSVGIAGKLQIVPASLHALTRDFLNQSGPELMARVRHEEYVAQEMSSGLTPDENPSLVPWEVLPESLRESNRRFAESVGQIIHDLGGQLVPLRHLDGGSFLEDDEALEQLAKDEHDRWMRALLADGWTFSEGPKDPHRKTHPLLVPWSELDEAEREKDRVAVRAIPRMLARVGFGIEMGRGQPR